MAHQAPTSHLMAWAVDRNTRQPVYILDLDESRSGSKSNCECSSCGLPLTGVNVAKTEYVKRPHFRHPNGAAENPDCMFQAARMAAMELLKSQGLLQLPSRKVRGQAIGISGTIHEVWVHRPPQQVKIRDFDFQDKAYAILTLDDGQQLRVVITGSGVATGPPNPSDIPTIELELGLPGIASLSLDELRNRLKLVPDESCWLSHWADGELLAQAEEEARQLAEDLIDLPGIHSDEMIGVDPKFRRETLLHLECKRILQEAGKIRVPGLHVFVIDAAHDGTEFQREWERPAEYLPLQDVKLEKRVGEGIPDVIAKIPDEKGGALLIEVTVTNLLDTKRRRRFAELGIAALEVDLSNMGGLITRRELSEWLVHGLDTKEWIYHPDSAHQDQLLRHEAKTAVEAHEDKLQYEEEERHRALAIPIQDLAYEYLSEVFVRAELGQSLSKNGESRAKYEESTKRIHGLAAFLAVHGFPESADAELIDAYSGIIPRIFSIQNGGGVCYDVPNLSGVMNSIKNLGQEWRRNHSIYLIAEKAFWGESGVKAEWFTTWVKSVRAAIYEGNMDYFRSGKYDRLLTLLFPELGPGLAHGFGTLSPHQSRPSSERKLQQKRATQNAQMETAFGLTDDADDFWLRGRELEKWLRAHPEYRGPNPKCE